MIDASDYDDDMMMNGRAGNYDYSLLSLYNNSIWTSCAKCLEQLECPIVC